MRELLVYADKTFKIEVPDDSIITFGPWSPPTARSRGGGFHTDNYNPVGTLRIYQGKKDNIVALFSGVTGFRDTTLSYAEEVAREEGAVIWNSSKDGYQREEKVQRSSEFVKPLGALPPGAPKPRRSRAKKTS